MGVVIVIDFVFVISFYGFYFFVIVDGLWLEVGLVGGGFYVFIIIFRCSFRFFFGFLGFRYERILDREVFLDRVLL